MWAWGLGWTITLCTLLVPALPALRAGTLGVGSEGAVLNEKTWLAHLAAQFAPSPVVLLWTALGGWGSGEPCQGTQNPQPAER